MNPSHVPSPKARQNSAIPELDYQPVDESDNDAPDIMPSEPSSMPRAEDDAETFEKSPVFHDRKAPEDAQQHKGIKNGHTSAAGYCLAPSAIRGGRRHIAVVM